MKWFWTIMLVLAVATGVLLARRSATPLAPPTPELVAEATPLDAIAPAAAVPEPAPPIEPPVADVPAPAATEPNPVEIAAAASAPVVEATPVESVTTIEPVAKEEPQADQRPPADAEEPVSESTQASDAPAAAPKLFKDQFEIVPARTKPGVDGVVIYDERFPVKGAGTPEDPMEVTWELLVSASETFQPRMGKKRLPERITMLDGKHARVTGYVAFPIMAAAQNEMLSMRNMWDGCCIGTPPTPYDALEVKLKGAATGRDRFTAFGTVEGVIKIDPYVKGNWLLGLYLMEDATLSQLKDATDPGKHGGM